MSARWSSSTSNASQPDGRPDAPGAVDGYDVYAPDHFKVGDLLHTSWGYDQTNVEFYKIIRVLPKSVEVVAIGGKSVPGTAGFMSEQITPDPDNVLTGE